VWLGASAASSARLVVLALFAPPLCPSSPPPLRAPSHDQQRRYSSGGGALALRPACQDGLDCACAPQCLTSPHLSLSPLPHQPPAPRPDAHRPTFRPKTTICEWPWRGCGQAAGAVCVKSSSPAGSAVPAAPAAPAVLVVLCPMATGTALPSDGMSTTRGSSTLRLAVASPSS